MHADDASFFSKTFSGVRLQVICQLRRAENIMFLSAELGRDAQIMVRRFQVRFVIKNLWMFELRGEVQASSFGAFRMDWIYIAYSPQLTNSASGCSAIRIRSRLPQRNAWSPYGSMLLQQRSALNPTGKPEYWFSNTSLAGIDRHAWSRF